MATAGPEDSLCRAEAIARTAHATQTDKSGRPYIEHVERVVAQLSTLFSDVGTAELEAAWLHDVVEDCGLTAGDLLDRGVSPRAVEIVSHLTRDEAVPYLTWIERLVQRGDLGVLRVKLADNLDNSDPSRPDFPGRDHMIASRYKPARRLIEAAILELEQREGTTWDR